ncbi:type II toxin-antitoxin system death-on-curing family toxin [Methylobacterium sp. WL69]|jgi:death-on-curing protein|uniref:type II toxin-antitoxin system death-on-curing family toxin n=1 Tax=Methylobacterium sp. WL69 TaxID=2603893 RepID=UPI0011C9F402|nr:type II toxin-antitoxin system death-on-curing family toxin [Methylobacterium sp. WL69]TXM73862.1 type II toxin-antitoxin system death-on-curing family toxin [Methylobacterium sp. WL69]
MTTVVRLTSNLVQAIHVRQSKLFGGRKGLPDGSSLESAVGRPVNRAVHGEADLAELAAACAFGIAKNHPFVDGNKRAALLALVVFLGLNGIDFVTDEAEAVVMVRGLAAGEITEEGLARWIRDNWPAT